MEKLIEIVAVVAGSAAVSLTLYTIYLIIHRFLVMPNKLSDPLWRLRRDGYGLSWTELNCYIWWVFALIDVPFLITAYVLRDYLL